MGCILVFGSGIGKIIISGITFSPKKYFAPCEYSLPLPRKSQKGVPENYGLRSYPLNLMRLVPTKGFRGFPQSIGTWPFCNLFSGTAVGKAIVTMLFFE